MTAGARNLRNVVLLGLVFAYAEVGGASLLATSPPPPICEEVCSSSSACDETCYENQMEFENGNDITCYDYGVWDEEAVCCGDARCDEGEIVATCEEDCGTTYGSCGECNPFTQTGCTGDDVCMWDHCCLPEGNGPQPQYPTCFVVVCHDATDCCSDSICVHDGSWATGTCYPKQ